MKVPVHIAEKLLRLSHGESIPSSSAKHFLIDDLVLEGIIERKGRIQKSLMLSDKKALHTYLQNNYSINSLQRYIDVFKKEGVTRSELVAVSAESKLIGVRTFKGFLVNCYFPIQATLNGNQIILNPVVGTFQFIYEFEKFILPQDITLVGIENPENFRHIDNQKYLFSDIKPLFISRYPQNQSKDLIKWLQFIPNSYLHFGDYDFAGIGIYLNEFKKHLGNKASFYIPQNIDKLIVDYGNRKRYNDQRINFEVDLIDEGNLLTLIDTIHKLRKGLDQEILIHIKSEQ
ncbi:DUF7281 domain-containing protein [Algoriphagus antarcticus]|jgi:hypothetical protein|uniref:DUF7281 domain-containing protein n=1 Tax=Algoriphagus antarcticus TaxID=238540 RepID=A0A3E0DX30_9BACT|nr:hypothetical protein [Algoriphagus antarcticus]REG87074.1 hypothetical protein C8N25_11153 [Algoriphagus antarcticus]